MNLSDIQIKNGWKIVDLRDIAELTSSKRIYLSDYVSSGIPFYRSKEIINLSLGDDISDVLYIAEEKFNEIKNKFGSPKIGDILITSVGTLGITYGVKDEKFYFKDGNLIWFRNFKEGFNSEYILYNLKSEDTQKRLTGIAIGSSQKAFTINALKNFKILIPPLNIQNNVAKMISTYDCLIQNNNTRIKILQSMAQKLYEEWFIHFKFPGYEKVKLIDSGHPDFGMIPEGWLVGKLSQVLENLKISSKPGQHLSSRKYVPIELIPRKNIALKEYTNWEDAQSSLILFEKGDILFGAMRPYFHKVAIAPFSGVTRQTCFVLRPKEVFYKSFGALTAFSERVVSFASNNTKGATIPYTSWGGVLSECPVIIPDNLLLKKFDKIVWMIIEEQMILSQNNFNLINMRDLLIPQLISGKIEIK